MTSFRLPGLAAALLFSSFVAAAAPDESGSGRFVFSLLPKSFQKDPAVDLAVITEVTDPGRKLPPPSAKKPIYYLAHTAGYHDEGQGLTGEKPLPVAELEANLEKSLAFSHYLAAPEGRSVTEVIFFVWGSHTKLNDDDLSLDPSGFVDVENQNLLSRAALVGGVKFAHEFEQALSEHAKLSMAGISALGPDPVSIFMNRDARTLQLVEQSYDDCYYVVASAYDAANLAKGRRILLWRTKMTTNSRGLSRAQTLPLLNPRGGPYFGKDMSVAATLTRRATPDGHVEIGTPTEVPDRDSSP